MEELAVEKLNFRTGYISFIHEVYIYNKCGQGKLIKFGCKPISLSNWQKSKC